MLEKIAREERFPSVFIVFFALAKPLEIRSLTRPVSNLLLLRLLDLCSVRMGGWVGESSPLMMMMQRGESERSFSFFHAIGERTTIYKSSVRTYIQRANEDASMLMNDSPSKQKSVDRLACDCEEEFSASRFILTGRIDRTKVIEYLLPLSALDQSHPPRSWQHASWKTEDQRVSQPSAAIQWNRRNCNERKTTNPTTNRHVSRSISPRIEIENAN